MVTGAASRPPSGLAFVTTTWCSNCGEARAECRRAKRQRRRAKKAAATSSADDATVEVAEAASVGTAVAEEKRCRRGTSN